MTTLTRNFETVSDYVDWLRERAAEARSMATSSIQTQGAQKRALARAETIDDIADDLSGIHNVRIAEIHG